ncbi:MAG: phosphate propanoyltransferase [Oscillibacter sp.]|nr:phosphate propanoyltransferase [Oscillibacter sp.]MBQ8852496.1 phosphate propanoyltransferase [Oscillibacter sp.]
MNYFSEQDIRDIVSRVLASPAPAKVRPDSPGKLIPVEISARHVHLTKEAVEVLFGKGYELTPKRELSQPGQYLCAERVKLVTAKGQLDNVAILGPVREENQVELSLTDARTLGVEAPIRLSGDLEGAADVLIVSSLGVVTAKKSVIVAKAHVHMTPADAKEYSVCDGEHVDIRMGTERPVTLNDVIVRVREDYALAVHIDFDEANAAQVRGSNITGHLIKSR